MSPAQRLLLTSLGSILILKAVALWLFERPRSRVGLALFVFAWPGVIAVHFRERRAPQPIDAPAFLRAWMRMAAGLVSIVLLAICSPWLSTTVLGLAGTAALLLTIHLGICDLLPWLLRWAGFPAPLLFDRPWAAASLTEFWSRRWNLAFVEMNRRLLLRPFHRWFGKSGAGFALFALSGLLHELGLSIPAGAGFGLPLAYFLLQGSLVAAEKRWRIAGRTWTWFWLLAPAPWLFHAAFRRRLILPFYAGLREQIARHPWNWYLSHAIYAAAIGHLLVFLASAQVPTRLGWKRDIAKLTRFNQKIFWVYGGYILFCIAGFATLSWRLHDAFLKGDIAARWMAGFIAVFWTIRVMIDIFWYDHRDWPQGNALLAGHALVTSLFCCLAAVYWCVALAPA